MNRTAKTPLALLILLALALSAAVLLAPPRLEAWTAVSKPLPAPAAPQSTAGSWYAVYFTDRTREGFDGGPDEPLVESLAQAQVSVDVAAYDLSLWSVRDALLDAAARGVSVRLVVEAENAGREEIQQLRQAGISVVEDTNDEGWMHDKFVIVDRQVVWTGSMNFTLNDAYRNDNNLLWIRSADVAALYLAEFEEMFTAGLFGASSPPGEARPPGPVNGTRLEVWFAPEDGVRDRIMALIGDARESIRFLAFSFTSDELSQAIIARAQEGVRVQGVFDEGQLNTPGGEFALMLAAGLDVVVDGNPDKMHHKVMILDEAVVITGSYNFSASAEARNDENVVFIFSPEVAKAYLDEFARVAQQAER